LGPTLSPISTTQLVESTASHRLFEDLLLTYYIPLENWYTRAIIDKVSGHN
jgi:conserved oligomeric Golgi complex subunit 4